MNLRGANDITVYYQKGDMSQLLSQLSQGDLPQLHATITSAQTEVQPNGSTVIAEVLTPVDCVRYTETGIAFQAQGRPIQAPADDEVAILTTSVSLCGTDLGLISKAQAGQLPPESQGKVVGHEAAGFVVGLGKQVTEWKIGDYVCLDSHFACSTGEHHHFADCVESGKSCDGIVGGIRGSLQADGSRAETRDGYWSRVMIAPVSALPVPLLVATAQHLLAPSTLESLGNIYMMVGQIDKIGLLAQQAKTLVVVSGLGATGYPMAAVATHYGFEVIGINPSASKRDFALQQGAVVAAYQSLAEAESHLEGKENVIVIETSGNQQALAASVLWINNLRSALTGRRAAIVFGLFSDVQAPMPFDPQQRPQRDFVFSRQEFKTTEGSEIYGVCGRDLQAWQTLMKDLEPVDGQPPKLVAMLNAAQLQVPGVDPLQQIATALNQGAAHVQDLLRQNNKLKLVANLMSH